MRTLLVTAHPVETSFNAALARAAREGLEAGGATVDLWDLYAEGFDPVMSRADRLAYHDQPGNAALAQGGLARLQQAEALVLCFPAWISSPPAMMKGWLEKLMLPGVAFSLAPWRPRLTNIHTIAGVVTYGGGRWRNWLAGDSARKMVTRGVWGYTGWRARVRYCAMYAVDKSTLEARQAFLGDVTARMQRLAEQAPGRPAAPPKAASAPNS
jgi:putative NADPH-quinone reductase